MQNKEKMLAVQTKSSEITVNFRFYIKNYTDLNDKSYIVIQMKKSTNWLIGTLTGAQEVLYLPTTIFFFYIWSSVYSTNGMSLDVLWVLTLTLLANAFSNN